MIPRGSFQGPLKSRCRACGRGYPSVGVGGEQGLPCRKRLRTPLPLCQVFPAPGCSCGTAPHFPSPLMPVHKPGIFNPLFGYFRPWVGVLAHQTGILSGVTGKARLGHVWTHLSFAGLWGLP